MGCWDDEIVQVPVDRFRELLAAECELARIRPIYDMMRGAALAERGE